ncbi:hypothetical protein BGHDH14_bgh04745 [Blumeria hordei DH14]|uniref:Uncharacterized protein n=1 Tax=Blumeria graminis f. sp. hordei (strain DH14) TaxID=546991 RepID=N1JBB1_BLUG1|nr:hypothetical protein BGHDH14_bgh04745 [Blumeria hordei DH14]
MQCLYALVIFRTPKTFYDIRELPTPPSEQFIVGGGEQPYYGRFQTPVASVFPTTDTDVYPNIKYYYIYQRQIQLTGHCSDFYTLNQIKVVMTKGLTPSPQTLDLSSEEEKICLNHLLLITRNIRAHAQFNLSEIPKYMKCFPNVIANLAFRNEISLSGKYRGFLPPGKTGPINVIVDKPIELDDVLDYGKYIFDPSAGKNGQAVALFQGTLHLFERGPKKTWSLKTTLLPTMENGKLIAEFFDYLSNFGQKAIEYIDTVEKEHGLSVLHNAWEKTPIIPIEMKPQIAIPLYQNTMAPRLTPVSGVIGEEENPLAKER